MTKQQQDKIEELKKLLKQSRAIANDIWYSDMGYKDRIWARAMINRVDSLCGWMGIPDDDDIEQ